MKNSHKGFIFTILVIIFLATSGVYFYFNLNQQNRSLSSISVIGSPVYKNELLRYELTLQPGWHISEIMSKKLDTSLFLMNLYKTIGCDTDIFIDKYGNDEKLAIQKQQECIKNSSDAINTALKYADFEKNWKKETSQNVFITNLSSKDEEKITLSDLESPQGYLPSGSFILLRPFDSIISFKEGTTSLKTGLVRSFYSADNTKSYLTDSRDTKLSSGGLVLSIPIISEKDMLYNGGKIQSLSIITTVDRNSLGEKDFYKIIDSLKLNQ